MLTKWSQNPWCVQWSRCFPFDPRVLNCLNDKKLETYSIHVYSTPSNFQKPKRNPKRSYRKVHSQRRDSFYSRAMDWAIVLFKLPTSRATWEIEQHPQHQVVIQSPPKPPSMPCCSRTFWRFFAINHKLAKGTKVTSVHIMQSSPTASEFLPWT